ncbi:hypothetical protein SPJ1_1365 [Streptococcus parauberis KRS-02083]|uniref:Uncharacterized protein n=1 Tax=Streptococcus parauberis KRS-02083 TaxID=1207545 RepID=A0ABP2SXR3_9STRE|nr:hypothetical protein SPJ1_1365 [Streptococcus parauberis KRS-02083]
MSFYNNFLYNNQKYVDHSTKNIFLLKFVFKNLIFKNES